ncbi:MAG: ATP-binding protein [Mobiluncus porci]|uniref:ATP-binding protein n=1 Tax=Mobiluncus porci TaxID=2652278 RepID=UPI0023EFFE66|nr:SbcC/MukB-like Walker B domain-containing protein [Mobiluncus porci]MDD7542281.1 ATP-binding protein [Mobiluncus porci]MDY5749080.1 ATP-binding protein [Mobiluncus porci]
MSDALFSMLEVSPAQAPGYRLNRFEVYNWGTFNGAVYEFTPGGETALLTGDIGSGKSTLIDGITTLLFPANRISYNRAAGADRDERSLRSYVQGTYKSERSENASRSRKRGLREGSQYYSVLLAVFTNESLGEVVSLAGVFQQRQDTGQPYRFYVTSKADLRIKRDFQDFGNDLNNLRKRLREHGCEIHDEFTKYETTMRRLLGIHSKQALELFHQTVSMKTVGDLNEFVREHMLEPSKVEEKIRPVVAHFEDLNIAYENVVRAREQLEALEPIAVVSAKYDKTLQARDSLEKLSEALGVYFIDLRLTLLDSELRELALEQAKQEGRRDELDRKLEQLSSLGDQLHKDLDSAGGGRLSDLEALEASARKEESLRSKAYASFSGLLEQLQETPVKNSRDFSLFLQALPSKHQELWAQKEEKRHLGNAAGVEEDRALEKVKQLEAEIADLSSRTSNLPSAQIQIRARLCDALGLSQEELPFAGELIDVKAEFAPWRGAAERVLRPFALSLLVPTEFYPQVSQWVNENHLEFVDSKQRTRGARLVYEKISSRQVPLQSLESDSLSVVFEVKEGPFESYLRNALAHRADYHMAQNLDEFRNPEISRAVTKEGQVRANNRHEKDDRIAVDDPRQWVLGWVNTRKVAALEADLVAAKAQLEKAKEKAKQAADVSNEIDARRQLWAKIEQFQEWEQLDYESSRQRAEEYVAEQEQIRRGSTSLRDIQARIDANKAARKTLSTERDEVIGKLTTVENQINQAHVQENQDRRELEQFGELLDGFREQANRLNEILGSEKPTASGGIEKSRRQTTERISRDIDACNREMNSYTNALGKYMQEMRSRWPEATQDMDTTVESRGEYLGFRDQLLSDGLPRFEKEFQEQLHTKSIQELANLNGWLNRQSESIGDRIDKINEALRAVPYNPNRYLRLEKERSTNPDISDFRASLRNLTDDALAGDTNNGAYSEQRYLEVKAIIDRFKGREGHSEKDKAWTARVTDVRNWFVFSASERWTETDEEFEHFSDSDGKSGGQKEKLAYTILAASLAYQFGLEWGAKTSKAFQFVLIDEAFGRGSDSSARYALELFQKLGLQLLIATPLTKVHVIEPFVKAIGFVDNPEGSNSRLHTLTQEEYRQRSQARSQATTVSPGGSE